MSVISWHPYNSSLKGVSFPSKAKYPQTCPCKALPDHGTYIAFSGQNKTIYFDERELKWVQSMTVLTFLIIDIAPGLWNQLTVS